MLVLLIEQLDFIKQLILLFVATSIVFVTYFGYSYTQEHVLSVYRTLYLKTVIHNVFKVVLLLSLWKVIPTTSHAMETYKASSTPQQAVIEVVIP